ncbi:MAG TPA: hypothetical protein VNN07_16655, partial [Candidatus Tectomicrobia bacterium]|nr:hypothetical protein [Candidatus Tectomicrobia bacterium]
MGQLHDVVHVLVVDTDAHRRTLLCTVLRHGGALPLDGEGVEDARRIVERIRPDVVVASLDDRLVDDRSLREAMADVPIIGITA